jgi:hypothetical protein
VAGVATVGGYLCPFLYVDVVVADHTEKGLTETSWQWCYARRIRTR